MKGILDKAMNDIYTATTLDECKALALNLVHQSKINDRDRNTMVRNINNSNTLIKLQTYLTNSYFVFNKMGLK